MVRAELGENGLYRDVTHLGNDRLAEMMMAHALQENCPDILAGETLAETAEAAEYHLRIQRIQGLEEFRAGPLGGRILAAATANYSKYDDQPQEFLSLDDLITKKKAAVVRTDTLNGLNLSKPEQVLFLRAVLIATNTRELLAKQEGKPFSLLRARIQRGALSSLRHMATNLVHVGEPSDGSAVEKFASAYSSNYLARSVLRELHTQGRMSHYTVSVDAALSIPIAFGQLTSGDQDEVVSVFPPGEKDEPEQENLGFKPVFPAEIDNERIERLRNMQLTFGGPYTEFRYYESIKPFAPDKKDKQPAVPKGGGPSEEDEDKEDYNYLVLEIVHPDAQDAMKTHVVADHPEVGNACYALRAEVLDEWERLVGIRLSWRDVFTQSRGTARQLGARRFNHNKGSNVEKRVNSYLRLAPEALVNETFAKIFDRSAGLFDDAMVPTEKNRMPSILISQIQASTVLRERWTAIREHGYAELHRHEAANARAETGSSQPRQREVSLQERAAQIFARILAEDFKN